MTQIRSALDQARSRWSDAAPARPQRAGGEGADAAFSRLTGFAPAVRVLERNRIVTMKPGQDGVAFDILRTKVLQQMRAKGWRRLAITSPDSECGKTTTAINLAFSMARRPELRTLLLEADLRRPAMAKMLGLNAPLRFGTVLDGRAAAADHLRRIGSNLAVGSNDGPLANPSEVLQNAGVPDVLAQIDATYAPDLMIFDMPPLLVSDDTMAFLAQVDCVLLVAAAGKSTAEQIDTCEQELSERSNLLGVVLTKSKLDTTGYGYDVYG